MPIMLATLSAYSGAKSADYVIWDKHTRLSRGWSSHDSQPADCAECIRDQQCTGSDTLALSTQPGDMVCDTPLLISTILMDTVDLRVFIRLRGHDDAVGVSAMERTQRLERVLPHLCRAARIQQRDQTLNELAALSTASLDTLEFGVMVIGHGLRVKYANAWTRAMMRANDCFSLDGGYLHSPDPDRDAAVRTLIEHAIGLKGVYGPAGCWMYSAPDGRSLPFIAAPLVPPQPRHAMSAPPLALVLIGNTETRSVMDARVLASMFGLTHAECTVAAHLAAGKTLKEIAQHQWKSLHTVRIHTREILRKTGMHRQSELMRLLHLLPSVNLERTGDEGEQKCSAA